MGSLSRQTMMDMATIVFSSGVTCKSRESTSASSSLSTIICHQEQQGGKAPPAWQGREKNGQERERKTTSISFPPSKKKSMKRTLHEEMLGSSRYNTREKSRCRL